MVTEEEIKKLVIVRLETMPSNIKISIGSEGSLSKKDLINHVKMGDELGKNIINLQLQYLRAMKSGFENVR